jgi:hypothetical protein
LKKGQRRRGREESGTEKGTHTVEKKREKKG